MLVTELLLINTPAYLSCLSKREVLILEANLFIRLCDDLCDYFYEKYQHYFHLIKRSLKKEKKMIDEKLVRLVVRDILSSGNYTMSGIACYARTTEDVVCDIVTGRHQDTSSTLFRKIIKLHQSVRPELYQKILQKITQSISQGLNTN